MLFKPNFRCGCLTIFLVGGLSMKTWKQIKDGEDHIVVGEDSSIQETEILSSVSSESSALVLIEKLLPGFGYSNSSLVLAKERTERNSCIACGYSSALEYIRSIPAVGLYGGEKSVSLTLSAIKNAVQLAGCDPLEEVRISLGLDKYRDELLGELKVKLCPIKGLSLLSQWTKQNLGKSCESIAEANVLFPNLTISELAFFPLLDSLPSFLLFYGSTVDIEKFVDAEDQDALRNNHSKNRVGQMGWATNAGIVYILDDYDSSWEDKGITTDPYQILGITGHREDEELVEFNVETKKIFRELIVLCLSSSRLYEKIWFGSGENLQIGLGRVMKLALCKIFGATAIDNEMNVQAIVSALSPDDQKLFEDHRSQIGKRLVSNIIYDVGRNILLDSEDLFRLVALFSEIPDCLVSDVPFIGFIQPYGLAMRFVGQNGDFVGTYPFHPLCGREIIWSFYAEQEEVSRENATVNSIFGELLHFVRKDLLERLVLQNSSLSLLEECAFQLWLDRGVSIDYLPQSQISELGMSVTLNHTISGKDFILKLGRKFGLKEARMISTVLRLLPKKMLESVKSVLKSKGSKCLADLLTGAFIEGYYDPSAKSITLVDCQEIHYGDFSRNHRLSFCFSLVHECGEAIWTLLSEKQKEAWTDISFPFSPKKNVHKHFLTQYAKTNEKEDFCEHFSVYVLYGSEFRMKAQKSTFLRKKYRFIKTMFCGFVGYYMEFPQILTGMIADITAQVDAVLEKMEMKLAVDCEEGYLRQLEQGASEHIFSVRQSLHILLDQDESTIRREESGEDNDDDDDEDDDYDVSSDVDDDSVDIRGIHNKVEDVLASWLEEDNSKLIRKIVDLIIEEDWDEVQELLDFLDDEDLFNVLSELHEIV
ncbi:MAG: hypothetical protein G01um101418_498 [Parcubacteria group bacterium Gr01-1014_18]|nr:MAG: hypothetical protein Greene041636_544 [Parcubacteria group bacterium Greene0416_36]TSC81085.1 MAG: hypothetical protein G01um101418_498 [Parcubacteria group bacterium Gr01-1014_18]TSC98819.1 MAG: hypothetical protein Greene101420_569 [Parcubacteria group bacterium Greene1014_20]